MRPPSRPRAATSTRPSESLASLLRIAQVEAGTRRSGFADLDLSEVSMSIAEVFGPVAEDAGQSFDATVATGLGFRGDRDLLTQMLASDPGAAC